jgi:hypothetical protein
MHGCSPRVVYREYRAPPSIIIGVCMLSLHGKGASMVKQSKDWVEKARFVGFKRCLLVLDAKGDVMDHSCMVLRW